MSGVRRTGRSRRQPDRSAVRNESIEEEEDEQEEAEDADATRMSMDVDDDEGNNSGNEEIVEPSQPEVALNQSRKRGRLSNSTAADTTTSRSAKRARPLNSSNEENTANNGNRAVARAAEPESVASSSQPPVSAMLRSVSPSFDMSERSGKVARIVLRNFMCHSNLVVDLNNRINLMIGHNGSGKSAILTALVIGMGSKATATSRSTNMTQLIKRGETNATVEIHLENYARDGFEFDKYGSRIIVQRSIFATGRSVYKLKNASGSVITGRRDELAKMLMFLNIQVDNPVCVLNQDASRSFLRDSDPAKRYQLYLKATQIETILEKLGACSQHVRKAKLHLRNQRQLALTHQRTVGDLRDRVAHLQSVGDLRRHIKSLRCQQSWKLVIVQEQLAAEMRATLASFQQQYDELQLAASSKASMEQRIRDEMAEAARKVAEMRGAVADEQEAHDAARRLVQEKQTLHDQLQRAVRKLEQRRERQRKDIEQLQADLAEQTAEAGGRVQRERAENEAKLVQLRAGLAETTAMVESARRDADMLVNTKTQALSEAHELKSQRQALQSRADKLQREIVECQTAAKDALLIYGPYMVRMVAAIEAAHKRGVFTQLPIGPLGRYVQLEDERWKLPIENILGTHVQSFIVNDAADRRVLSEMIRQQFPEHARYSIINTRFVDKVYDVRRGAVRPPPGSRLAMDVMRVSNAVVMNCLIDQCKVEMILLTEDEQVAMRLTADEENVPQHLIRVVLTAPFSVFYPEPNYRSYSIEQRHARYLQVNLTQRREFLEAELGGLRDQMAGVEAKIAEQRTRMEATAATLATKSKQRQQLEEAMRTHGVRIKELEMIEYPAEADAEFFRKELAELQTAIGETDAAIEAERARLAEHATLMATKTGELDLLKQAVHEKELARREVQRQHDEAQHRLQSNAVTAQYGEAKCRAMDADMQKLRSELAEAEAKVARLQVSAEKLGERVVTKCSDEELQRKLSAKERRVVAIESTEETLEMVVKRLTTSEAALEHTESLVRTLAETLAMLSAARQKRYETLAHMKQTMSLRVHYTFNNLLKLRNYSGEITIDDKAQTLELSVVPRDKHIENAVCNTKSLSGGERSYSTIAFLLSLWSCVNYPFYFLDEYDVFTDQVNRHYITKLLLSEANKKMQRQYTFLTPQDMSNVEASDIISIHRLAEPDR